MDTGDIVLFSGKGRVSECIKWFTRSRWSHVGMIVRIDEWDEVLLWESTTLSSVADALDGTSKRGVQTVLLSERLRAYDGDVAYRALVNPPCDEESREALRRFRLEVRDRDYETSKLELLRAEWDGPFGQNQEDLSSLFCSELIAEAYQRMGLLGNDPPSNEYTPRDFSQSAGLKLLRQAHLGQQVPIAGI